MNIPKCARWPILFFLFCVCVCASSSKIHSRDVRLLDISVMSSQNNNASSHWVNEAPVVWKFEGRVWSNNFYAVQNMYINDTEYILIWRVLRLFRIKIFTEKKRFKRVKTNNLQGCREMGKSDHFNICPLVSGFNLNSV